LHHRVSTTNSRWHLDPPVQPIDAGYRCTRKGSILYPEMVTMHRLRRIHQSLTCSSVDRASEEGVVGKTLEEKAMRLIHSPNAPAG
ncbi:unnamed protein product, partial [Ectocarpus sp. 12 AP-2014]